MIINTENSLKGKDKNGKQGNDIITNREGTVAHSSPKRGKVTPPPQLVSPSLSLFSVTWIIIFGRPEQQPPFVLKQTERRCVKHCFNILFLLFLYIYIPLWAGEVKRIGSPYDPCMS